MSRRGPSVWWLVPLALPFALVVAVIFSGWALCRRAAEEPGPDSPECRWLTQTVSRLHLTSDAWPVVNVRAAQIDACRGVGHRRRVLGGFPPLDFE